MTGSFGKPDATGRSSGKLSGRARRLRSPPRGESWIWLTRELLESPAWRALNPNARKLIDFLLVEYMAMQARKTAPWWRRMNNWPSSV